MPIINVPPRRILTLLRRIRERNQEFRDQNKITTETVERSNGDGTYTVAGNVLTTTGDAALRAGQEVAVASKAGKPAVIVEHNVRRAQFAPSLAPPANPLIEELFFATDPATGEPDVYIRNYSQVTPLGVETLMGAQWARGSTQTGLFFNVAEDDALFSVPKVSTASLLSVPKELPIFKLNRRREHPADPTQRMRATLLKTVDLSWVQSFFSTDLITLDKGLALSVTVVTNNATGGLTGLLRTWIDGQARVFILVNALYTFNFGSIIGEQTRRLTVFDAETHDVVWDSVVDGVPFLSPSHYLFPTATDGVFRSLTGDVLDITGNVTKLGLRIDATDFTASTGAVFARGVFLYYPNLAASLTDQLAGNAAIGRSFVLKALSTTDTDDVFLVTEQLYNRHRYLWGKGPQVVLPDFSISHTGPIKMTLLDEDEGFATTQIGTDAVNWLPLGLFVDGRDFILRTGFNFDTVTKDDTIKPLFLSIDQLNQLTAGFPQEDLRLKPFKKVKDLPSNVVRFDGIANTFVIYRVVNEQDTLRPLGRFKST